MASAFASLQRAGSCGVAPATSSAQHQPSQLVRTGSAAKVPMRRTVSCAASAPQASEPSTADIRVPAVADPFVAAGSRLKSLLSRVGDGEEELTNTLVAEETPEKKLQTSVLLGGFVTVGAIVVSTLCNKDPWGGAALSLHSMGAAAIGAAAALPFVWLRNWTWTPQAYELVPALQDVHEGQLELHRPWLTSMSVNQVALMMALEVVPLTLLLFPAAQGGIAASLSMYSQLAMHGAGLSATDDYMAVTALMVTAAICGVGRSLELSVSDEEYDLVTTASANADRFYRTVTTDINTTPSDAARSAEAFKCVAQAWLQTKGEASLMAGVITGIDVVLLGVLWHLTGDLTAPAVAALAVNWVDFSHLHLHLHREVLKKEAKNGPTTGRGTGSGRR